MRERHSSAIDSDGKFGQQTPTLSCGTHSNHFAKMVWEKSTQINPIKNSDTTHTHQLFQSFECERLVRFFQCIVKWGGSCGNHLKMRMANTIDASQASANARHVLN